MNIKLELLISKLGQPEKKVGDEYFWQCPFCKDRGKDNLKFNNKKGIIWCFANNNHAPQLLKQISKGRRIIFQEETDIKDNKDDKFEKCFTKQKQSEFKNYTKFCNEFLLRSPSILQFLKKKRGLTSATVKDVQIGFDSYKKMWIIPSYLYSTENNNIILGFEYRPFNFNKNGLFRERGTPTGLSMINSYKTTAEILVVVEGYFDGYALYQYLSEQNQIKYYHIATPSNGIHSLAKNIAFVDFNKYKKFYLYVDNDNDGNTAAEKIQSEFPIFERFKTQCNCKDFNEHYLKCINKKSGNSYAV